MNYLEHCEAEKFPEVIFVDIDMPFNDGFGFLKDHEKKFSGINPNTHIYMLTSSKRSSDHEKALSYCSVKDILVKPVTKDNLQEILNSPVK